MNHSGDITNPQLAGRVRDLMPQLTGELIDLVAIRSASEPGFANMHGPNERVLPDDLEKAALAEADLFGGLAACGGGKH